MERALVLAAMGRDEGEVPVGAVVVIHDACLGEAYNQPIRLCDATAHAEVPALRKACQQAGNYRIPGATLYVTLEPCTMCVGALIHARISRLVFAASEPRAGALIGARQLLSEGYYNHKFTYEGGLMAEASRQMLSDFFRERRR